MRLLINVILWGILGILAGFLLVTLRGPDIRTEPHYKGIDKRVENLVNQYKVLAAKNGIFFSHVVTIGFTNIQDKNTLGITHFGSNFREIDVDTAYWNNASEISRKTVLFHELTHSYCGRSHDYGYMKPYSTGLLRVVKVFQPSAGFLPDSCPLSIMYPYILEDYCMEIHYDYYIHEMFSRCDPY